MPSLPKFVLAAVGHNESAYLPLALSMLKEAAGKHDEVWFVDSASTDDSASIAEAAGAHVLSAPLGKGRAVAHALARADADHVCLLDADLVASELNIAGILREAALARPADMIVGQFWQPGMGLMPSTVAVYPPLIEAFFPEVGDRFGTKPLSGFRVLSRRDLGTLPPTFGLESYLNIESTLRGWRTYVVDIGRYEGRFLRKPLMPYEIAETILERAEAHGRLAADGRQAWMDWIEELAGPLKEHEGAAEQYASFRSHLHSRLAAPRPEVGPRLSPAVEQ